MSFVKMNWLATGKNQTKNSRRGGGAYSYSQLKAKKEFKIKNGGKMSRTYEAFAGFSAMFLLAFTAASIFAPVNNSSAEEQQVDAVVVNGLSGVSVTAGQETITLNVGQPSATGTIAKAGDVLTAQTAAASGYQLYVSMNSNQEHGNRLYLGGDTSDAYISPNHDNTGADIPFGSETALNTNSWGFTTDDTKYENDQFAAVPIMGDEVLIDETSAAGENEIDIYYGVKVNTNMSTGTYSGDIVYTIIAEDTESDNYSTPSIADTKGVPYMTTTVTLPLRSSVGTVSELGTINATVGGSNCLGQTATLNNASVSVSCTLPVLSAGAKDVAVYIQQYATTYTAQSAFTYITNMQEMTTEMCDKIGTNYRDTAFTLADSRDTKTYKIIKHKDGNCWMNQNLALDGGRTLHTTDSNVTQDRTLNANISSGTAMTTARDFIFSGVATNYTTSCGSYQYCITSTEPYGNHYNWIAATAGVGNATQDNTVYESVCPSAGNNETWRLPDNGVASGAKTFSNLASAYSLPTTNGANGSAVQTIQRSPLSFPLTGYYSSSAVYQGHNAYYWSRTSVSGTATRAYLLGFGSNSGNFYPQGTDAKSFGFSVRCVLGE